MPWLGLLTKLSPERVAPILREGQCKPVSDCDKPPNMPSDHHESPSHWPAVEEHDDESSSIGDSSLLEPPTSHRLLHPRPFPQSDPQGLHSFVDAAHDPSVSLSATTVFGSTAPPSGPMHAITYPEYSDGISLPNPLDLSPHPSWLHEHGRTSPPPPNIVPATQPVVSPDGYAPAESLPPQNYFSPARTMPRSSAPFYPPTPHGASLLTLGAAPPTHGVPSPTAVVPPNSELARPPRFTFAPPGADVPADPVASATGPSPTSGRRRDKEKAKGKIDKALQPVAEGSVRRARSNSWSVVSSVFRRKSGRHSGPPPLATDVPPRLTAGDWRDLAKWAHRPSDDSWGESFEEYGHASASFSAEPETGSNPYDRQLPPLPPHLSHLPAPTPPLLRPDSSTSALNPFLAHRPVGLPPLAWDLRAGARAILFPSAVDGGPALPMAASDYAQPATWPPCGALRIGAIGEHAGWRWPVEAHNPAGVRCGDVFRALVANLHEFVGPREIARMPPERVAVVAAACAARVAVGTPDGPVVSDGIRRVDCLLGCTQFHGLEPGPSAGEWTMYVGAP